MSVLELYSSAHALVGDTLFSCVSFLFPSIVHAILVLVPVCLFVKVALYLLNGRLSPEGKSVYITGCDTGFGNMLAKQLDSMGYRVFAACLSEKGAVELQKACSERLTTLQLDVTKEADIARGADLVKSKCGQEGLWAVVNNAGIACGGLMEFTTMEEWRLQLEVNFFGVVAVTKSVLPLVMKAQGRVVNVASLAGRVAAPAMGPYSASKFAVEAMSDSLRREMRVWNVKVSTIEPGFMATPIVKNSADTIDKMWQRQPKETKERYGEEWAAHNVRTANTIYEKLAGNPQQVVDAMIHAIERKAPETHYLLGVDALVLLPFITYKAWLLDFLLAATDRIKPARALCRW